MKITKLAAIVGLSVLTLSACQTTKEAENMASLDVSFDWHGTSACSTKSPAFIISNIPADTASLRFKMVDLDVPTYNHGGGAIDYSGSSEIPAGAFSYKGPCPPSGSHDYRFTVTALNADGSLILGKGEETQAFPPK
ncbi:hypothetical protein [Thalassospira sp.]|uniref:hypothetical protein n=1 Tax=Thalassospira sp. TaxID=1912094 RepID=UPI001B0DFA23|nr:hypothetical protein [Thalassospira sp.]MBO6578636.1 hypothetical protein [Thalassospira sp.]